MTADALRELLDSLATLPYGGEPIDQRTHALQCSWHALHDLRDDAFVIACALHDIGRAPAVASVHPGVPHEVAGARFVARFLPTRAAALIAGHVDAKRYLVSVDDRYRAALSRTSVVSLARQGGGMSADERAQFEADPICDDLIALRRYDDAAKRPGAPTASIEEIVAIYERLPHS